MVAVVGLLISSRVRLTELNSEKSRKEAELNQVISETKRLESELAARTSAKSVEEYAKANGMQKMEPGQIAYITVEDAGADAGEDGTEPGFWWNMFLQPRVFTKNTEILRRWTIFPFMFPKVLFTALSAETAPGRQL